MPPRKTTKTSSFGSPGRAGHDASAFYSARLYEGQTTNLRTQGGGFAPVYTA